MLVAQMLSQNGEYGQRIFYFIPSHMAHHFFYSLAFFLPFKLNKEMTLILLFIAKT